MIAIVIVAIIIIVVIIVAVIARSQGMLCFAGKYQIKLQHLISKKKLSQIFHLKCSMIFVY